MDGHKVRQQLVELVGTRRKVRLTRRFHSEPRHHGFVLALGREWVLLQQFHDFYAEGYAALRVRDITHVRSGENEQHWERMLAAEGLLDQPAVPGALPLDEISQLLTALQQRDQNVVVECEEDVKHYYIGQILSVDANVTVFLSNGDGTLSNPVSYPTNSLSTRLDAAVDLDGDGDADLVIDEGDRGGIGVLLNQGNGTFGAEVDLAAGKKVYSAVAADVNGDGLPELAFTSADSNDVGVLANLGSGKFASAINYDVVSSGGPIAELMAAADVDADGDADLAIMDGEDHKVLLLFNQGNGSFTSGVTPINWWGTSMVWADLNDDGKSDLAILGGADKVAVLFNQGNGTFAPEVTYATSSAFSSIVAGDMNSDGQLDLAFAGSTAGHVSVLFNQGNGTFAPEVTYAAALTPRWIVAADLDGDDRLDLAVANEDSWNVSVMLNPCLSQ